MDSAAAGKIQRLLAIVSTAEAARLAEVLARIGECHALARQLRDEAAASGQGPSDAAELVAISRWRRRLHERVHALAARAKELEGEAVTLRRSLAIAHGRESAAAAMVKKARTEERRQADRRAESALIPSLRAAVQPTSSGSDPVA